MEESLIFVQISLFTFIKKIFFFASITLTVHQWISSPFNMGSSLLSLVCMNTAVDHYRPIIPSCFTNVVPCFVAMSKLPHIIFLGGLAPVAPNTKIFYIISYSNQYNCRSNSPKCFYNHILDAD